jgi:hypothetical protein
VEIGVSLPKVGDPTMQPTRKTFFENIRAQPVELLNMHQLNTHLRTSIDSHARVTVPYPDRPSISTDARGTASELNDRIGNWVNEGGAGGEVNR